MDSLGGLPPFQRAEVFRLKLLDLSCGPDGFPPPIGIGNPLTTNYEMSCWTVRGQIGYKQWWIPWRLSEHGPHSITKPTLVKFPQNLRNRMDASHSGELPQPDSMGVIYGHNAGAAPGQAAPVTPHLEASPRDRCKAPGALPQPRRIRGWNTSWPVPVSPCEECTMPCDQPARRQRLAARPETSRSTASHAPRRQGHARRASHSEGSDLRCAAPMGSGRGTKKGC